MKKSKNSFIVCDKDVTSEFVGNAQECARYIGTNASYIRKVSDGGYIEEHFVKQIYEEVIIYCIDKNGKHYESTNIKKLQKYVWYSPVSIRIYCLKNVVMNDGTKFYCKRKKRDYERPIYERKHYK